MSKIIFNKFSNERAVNFNIRTEIVEDEGGKKKVRKISMGAESRPHVENMLKFYQSNGEKYVRDGIELAPCVAYRDGVEFEYIEGKSLNEILVSLLEENDTETFNKILNRYLEFMEKQSDTEVFYLTEDVKKIFGDCSSLNNKEMKVCYPTNIDVIFDNIVCQEDKWKIFDYEWVFDFPVPKNFIVYRSIFYLIYRSPYEEKLNQMDLYGKAGIPEEEIGLYQQMEQKFQKYVVGDRNSVQRYYQKGIDVKKLVAEQIWKEKELSVQIYKDCGEGIKEETSYRIDIPLNEEREYYFDIEISEEVREVRVDPGDEQLLLKLENAAKLVKQMNGRWLNEEWIYFTEKDPWMIIDMSEVENGKLIFCGQVGKVDVNVKHIIDNAIADTEKEQEVARKQQETIEDLQQRMRGLTEKEQILQNKVQRLQEKTCGLQETNNMLQEQVRLIAETRSWRWTELFRKVYRKVKKADKRKDTKPIDISEERISYDDVEQKGIAIHLHLFYVDLLDEFLEYFSNIPYEFDLYISCIRGSNIGEIQDRAKKILKNVRKVKVKIFENRGRDIAPFYVGFHDELIYYEYVLHVHSKKSKHIETGGSDWRRYSLDSLVGSEEQVKKIFDLFQNGQNIGLIYPECHPDIPMIGYTWMGNLNQGTQFLSSMRIHCRNGLFNYPAGSFFWVKMDAIRPLMERNMTLADFPEEAGQIDGTFAHVLERALVYVVESCGYHSCIIDIIEDKVRYDKSTKPYRDYMAKDKNAIQKELEKFDSISFSVFDTLVDFVPYGAYGIVECMREKFGFNQDFITLRIEAERIAREKFGSAMNVDDIYAELIPISPFDENVAAMLKQTEIELLQLNMQPRREMQEIYRNLVQQGKRVSIVCDTCYPSWVIEAILVKCGFIGYEKMWVSCEYGVSKRDEQMWNLVYAEYDPEKHVHVGSDVYADWYTLERRGTASMWVMSAEEAYRLSKQYDLKDNQVIYPAEEAMEIGKKVKEEMFNSTFGLTERDVLI